MPADCPCMAAKWLVTRPDGNTNTFRIESDAAAEARRTGGTYTRIPS